jgi:hypothetical protein
MTLIHSSQHEIQLTVGDSHAFSKWTIIIAGTGSNAVGTFMHIQKGTNTVAGSMTEVQTISPQSVSGKRVEEVACE